MLLTGLFWQPYETMVTALVRDVLWRRQIYIRLAKFATWKAVYHERGLMSEMRYKQHANSFMNWV
jgi:hypothetical protein